MPDLFRNYLPVDEATGESSRERWIEPDALTTGKILGYFGRTTARAQIRQAVVRRYGTGIKKEKGPNGTEFETYVRGEFATQVDQGQIEIVCLGFGHSITASLSLFVNNNQKFSVIPKSGVPETGLPDNVKKAAEYLDTLRQQSQFMSAMTRVSDQSVQLASSMVRLEFSEGKINYHVVDPGKVKVRFDGSILSDGNPRPVDTRRIDDATCVIIETGDSGEQRRTFLAIYGRSPQWPLGRYVTYESGGDGKDVPAPVLLDDQFSELATSADPVTNTQRVQDWVNENGEIANPLSWYADQNPDLNPPEYPLAVFYGGQTSVDSLLPISTDLLDESIEFDVAASHLRSTAADAARGSLVISRGPQGTTAPLPRNLRGDVVLEMGLELKHEDHDAAASKTGWDLLSEQRVAVAMSYGVPNYRVSDEDHTVEGSSGTALAIRTAPLQDRMSDRADLNAPSVERVFEIEKALIVLHADVAPAVESALKECSQVWDPGTIQLPQDEKQIAETIKALVDSGLYDTIEAIRVAYRLPSESDAIDMYEKLKARRKKYPPLNQEEIDARLESENLRLAKGDPGGFGQDQDDGGRPGGKGTPKQDPKSAEMDR